MLQHVNTVLIGKATPATYTTAEALNSGDVALFDQNRAIVKTAADAAKATSLYVGVAQKKVNVTMPNGSVAQKANIKFSNEIQKNSKPSAVIGSYVAPVQEKIVIDLAASTIVAGHRYVLRVVYKDMYEAPGQFTHTYEAIASDATAESLVASIVKAINKHANRRVVAVANAKAIELTAMEKTDNEGVNSLNNYSIVSMEATMYVTIPGALLSNQPEVIPGAVITKTVGNPGKGYWKQVRDAEVKNMGYQGHVFTGAYPIVEQSRMVEEGASYDYITIENDNLYLSNDNQYIKTTPLTTELYVKSAANFDASVVAAGIKAFIAA